MTVPLSHIVLASAFVAAAGFTVDYFLYGLHRDRKVEGWHLLTFTACLALVFGVLLVPDFPGRQLLLHLLAAAVSLALWWRWALLRRVRRKARR